MKKRNHENPAVNPSIEKEIGISLIRIKENASSAIN